MSEEYQEQEHLDAVSEPQDEPRDEEQVEQKMVPLAALQAERRKRQDLEARAQLYEEMIRSKDPGPVEQEEQDPSAIVERRDLMANTAHTKREILETLYQDMNPKAVQEINKYLKPILEKKPWLASSVDSAQNRYARAHEIVQDYLHLVVEKQPERYNNSDGKRIVENAHKPRSPTEVGKSARPEGAEYLKSIQGTKEFREYRQNMLRGRP